MILADTSIWVTHLRKDLVKFKKLLRSAEIYCHPFIIGELACGHLNQRKKILELLQELPSLPILEHEEVLYFIERHQLMGKGLGWVDLHLLASAYLAQVPLWTLDKKLLSATIDLQLYP